MTIHVTKNDFDTVVLHNDKPVVVDFWADWCGPCKMLAPIIDKLDQELDDVVFAKVDTEAEPELAQRFKIRSIPNLIIFKNGEAVGNIIGLRSAVSLKNEIENIVHDS